MSVNTKMTVRCALFAAVSLIIYVIESLLPPLVPVPGARLGLANTVTLAAVYILGNRAAFFVLAVRIVLSSVFAGQAVSFLYSFCGGMCCYAVTVLLKSRFGEDKIWAIGVIGAIFHNIGQLAVGYFLIGGAPVLYYGFVMTACACVTGTFTGLCAQYAVKRFGIMSD